MASTIRCEPPRAMGQPAACPSIASISPNAADGACSIGRQESAHRPAISALARVPRKKRSTSATGRREGPPGETRQQDRMARQPQRGKDVGQDLPTAGHQGFHQFEPGVPVGLEVPSRPFQRTIQHHSRTVIERMRQRHRRLGPCQAVLSQRQRGKERRGCGHGKDRCAGVVDEARQCQLRAAAPAADGRRHFQHGGRVAGAGHFDRGGQPVRT